MGALLDKLNQFVSSAIASIQKPKATVMAVDLKGINLDSVSYSAKVNVSNPWIIPIPIGTSSYILKSSNSVIASGTILDPGSLKGYSNTLLDVEIKVPHTILISLVEDIAADWDIDYELLVDLVLQLPLIGDITILVSKSGQIKLPSLIDFFKI